MKNFRTLLATALLTLPVAAMASMPSDTAATGPRLEAKTSLTPCCWILLNGRYICFPC